MSTPEHEIKDISNAGEPRKELDKENTSILDIIKETELPSQENDAINILADTLEKHGYNVETVSDRNGFRIILAEKENNRYLVWIRGAPISRKTLGLVEKYIAPYEDITEKILVKLVRKADYVKVAGWVKIHK